MINIGSYHAKQKSQYQSLGIVDNEYDHQYGFNGPSSYSPNSNVHYLSVTENEQDLESQSNQDKDIDEINRIDIMKEMYHSNKIREYIEQSSSSEYDIDIIDIDNEIHQQIDNIDIDINYLSEQEEKSKLLP